MSGQIVQVAVTLAGIVLLIFVIAFVAKSARRGLVGDSGLLKIIASLSVGVKEKLVLIQVGDEQILITLSGAGIQKLHVIAQPIPLPLDADSSQRDSNSCVSEHSEDSFKDRLEGFLEKN